MMSAALPSSAKRVATLVAVLVATVLAFAAVPAPGATDAQRGGRVLQQLEAGATTCGALTASDFDDIGEYVTQRMLGSAGAREAMNGRMAAMMGTRGETQARIYMGRRFSGCATGRAPAAFGVMMGMMGGDYNGNAGMMGYGARGDDWSGRETVMVVVMGLLLALATAALFAWHPWRRPDLTPLDVLRTRFARGDIDQQEFDCLRRTLETPA